VVVNRSALVARFEYEANQVKAAASQPVGRTAEPHGASHIGTGATCRSREALHPTQETSLE
jgi:hypothetical protein